MVDKADKREEDGLTGGCLDDGGLANTGGIEVDVGTFLSSFSADIEIKDFDNVADEIR